MGIFPYSFVCLLTDRSETARHLLEEHAPVGVVDDCGQPAMTWMISKMAPVAKEALDQLHTCDRANRKQYFYLNHLEPIKPGMYSLHAICLVIVYICNRYLCGQFVVYHSLVGIIWFDVIKSIKL